MNRSVPPAPGSRLAIVLSHPIQYYSPWFRWLSRHLAVEFRVFYLWDSGTVVTRDREFGAAFKWDVDLLTGYDHEFVPNCAADPGTHHFGGLRNPALPSRLAAFRPDALLLFGYNWHSLIRAILWARVHRIPLIFRGDSHFLGRKNSRPLVKLALRLLYRQFAAVTYVGAANRDYFTALGVPSRRLFFAPHAVNHEFFENAAAHDATAALRLQLGIAPSTKVVLFAGKLIALKQVQLLLDAFLALAPSDAALVIVGDGEQKEKLIECARRAPAGSVHFLPFANQSEMPARYLLADLFVLPSDFESWGLAVNEAMHLGVPCLVSDVVGCHRDLITDGATGWVFRSRDGMDLRTKLGEALSVLRDPVSRQCMHEAVLARIAQYTYEQTTRGLEAAVEYALPPR